MEATIIPIAQTIIKKTMGKEIMLRMDIMLPIAQRITTPTGMNATRMEVAMEMVMEVAMEMAMEMATEMVMEMAMEATTAISAKKTNTLKLSKRYIPLLSLPRTS